MKLYQFPVSHFCEKVRWALDYKGLGYQTVDLLPGRHARRVQSLASGSHVPLLLDEGRKVQGSAAILDYLDQRYPQRSLIPDSSRKQQQIRQWEQRLDDETGPDVRLLCYHYLLQQPSLMIPMLTYRQPWYTGVLLRLGFGKVESTMRRWMRINERTALAARQRLEQTLKELGQGYEENAFLVGSQFSRADLTAAALLAPLFQPAQFDIPWPQAMPSELQDWINQQRPYLKPLQSIYERYRSVGDKLSEHQHGTIADAVSDQ
ncbi:hypothetical protein GCM10011297_00190 [Bacterioplanes sanyensis]|uniref:glutathione S-transferase family protein n=1 Tax=Bacterioplanes sanyensis TaxID=1249553 RepID=UPI00167B3171|nr:glutathione S-transferase N-terminal domain-containing protein [Bacterioplanes sanyensis]GGY31463.1 hypothetical protein GCM10011297_00190 [Bacterioplanes sanyensis]